MPDISHLKEGGFILVYGFQECCLSWQESMVKGLAAGGKDTRLLLLNLGWIREPGQSQ